jgi:hypothetical protein
MFCKNKGENMRASEFEKWLSTIGNKGRPFSAGVIKGSLSDSKRLDEYFSDLDVHYLKDSLKEIEEKITRGIGPPPKPGKNFDKDSFLYVLRRYQKFCDKNTVTPVPSASANNPISEQNEIKAVSTNQNNPTDIELPQSISYLLNISTESLGAAGQDIDAVKDLPQDPTERQIVIAARLGQGKFRQRLIDEWQCCAVTGCGDLELLRASHIKPWRDGNNHERLSPDNGLLLSAHLDAAFDRGFISFSDDGRILVNKEKLTDSDASALGIDQNMRLHSIRPEHIHYLNVHRALWGFKS